MGQKKTLTNKYEFWELVQVEVNEIDTSKKKMGGVKMMDSNEI